MKKQIFLLLRSRHQLNNPSKVKELPRLKLFRGKFLLSWLVADFLQINKDKVENHCPSRKLNGNVIKGWKRESISNDLVSLSLPVSLRCGEALRRAQEVWISEVQT